MFGESIIWLARVLTSLEGEKKELALAVVTIIIMEGCPMPDE